MAISLEDYGSTLVQTSILRILSNLKFQDSSGVYEKLNDEVYFQLLVEVSGIKTASLVKCLNVVFDPT